MIIIQSFIKIMYESQKKKNGSSEKHPRIFELIQILWNLHLQKHKNLSMNSLKEYYNDSVFIIRKITSYISDWEKPMKTKQKRLLAANKFLKGKCGLPLSYKAPDETVSFSKNY